MCMPFQGVVPMCVPTQTTNTDFISQYEKIFMSIKSRNTFSCVISEYVKSQPGCVQGIAAETPVWVVRCFSYAKIRP